MYNISLVILVYVQCNKIKYKKREKEKHLTHTHTHTQTMSEKFCRIYHLHVKTKKRTNRKIEIEESIKCPHYTVRLTETCIKNKHCQIAIEINEKTKRNRDKTKY